jgi:hypothetical protein
VRREGGRIARGGVEGESGGSGYIPKPPSIYAFNATVTEQVIEQFGDLADLSGRTGCTNR